MITDELREWARGFENVWFKPASKEIVVTTGTSMPVDHVNMCLFIEGMLDRVDAELAERYVALPVDANDVPIHLGDRLTDDADYKSEGVVENLMLESTGWYVNFGAGWADERLHDWHHYTPPTVEDVLREFADRYLDYEGIPSAGRRGVGEALMDEYAAKLQLAGEDE